MQNRPTAVELLDAVRELLSGEVLPTIQDDGLRFKVLIAANVLAVVSRELSSGNPLLKAELARLAALLPDTILPSDKSSSEQLAILNQQLVTAIREANPESAAIGPNGPIWMHVEQTLRDQLRIANPKFALD